MVHRPASSTKGNRVSCLIPLAMIATTLIACAVSAFAGSWAQWRGPARDGHASSDAPAITELPAQLTVAWRLTNGGGFSSPVVQGDLLAYLDENGEKEIAHVVNARTGKEIWHEAFADRFSDEWGAGPRSTPMIDGDRLYALSCNGEFRCWKVADGKPVWSANFEKDFGIHFAGMTVKEGTSYRRGNNGSAAIDGEAIIIPVGNTQGASLVCLNKLTGKPIWKSGNDEVAYSWPVVVDLAGVRQIVFFSAEAVMGFRRDNGKVLWRIPLKTNAKRHAATPIINGDNVIVSSHTFGTVAVKVTAEAGEVKAKQAWINTEQKVNVCTYLLMDGFLYGHGALGTQNLACVDAATGATKWTQSGFGKEVASVMGVGKNMLVLSEDGQLVLLAPNPDKYSELGRVQVCGKNWNFPAYADGRLYIRDYHELIAYKLP